MPPSPLVRIRRLCLKLPEAHEAEAWSAPTFRVRNKMFAMYSSVQSSHSGGRSAVWIKAAPGEQGLMVRTAPKRFFIPPYMGPSGWVGVWLDAPCDWKELTMLLTDGYRLVAPKRLALSLEQTGR